MGPLLWVPARRIQPEQNSSTSSRTSAPVARHPSSAIEPPDCLDSVAHRIYLSLWTVSTQAPTCRTSLGGAGSRLTFAIRFPERIGSVSVDRCVKSAARQARHPRHFRHAPMTSEQAVYHDPAADEDRQTKIRTTARAMSSSQTLALWSGSRDSQSELKRGCTRRNPSLFGAAKATGCFGEYPGYAKLLTKARTARSRRRPRPQQSPHSLVRG